MLQFKKPSDRDRSTPRINRRYLSICLILWFSFLFTTSCNIINTYYNIQIKQLERRGFSSNKLISERDSIHYLSKLTGNPLIVLLHSFSSDGVNQFRKTAILLSKEYDIIIPDLLFHGQSTTNDTSYTLDVQVQVLEKILTELKIDSGVNLVGNSYGGLIASIYALQNNDMISKLIIYNTPLMFFSLSHADSIARLHGIDGAENLLCPQTSEELRKTLSFVFHKPPIIPDFILNQMIAFANMQPREEKIKLLKNLEKETEKYPDFRKSDLPELYLLWGENDVFIPIDVFYSLKNYWKLPDDRAFIISKTAHIPNIERPKKFSKKVGGFLKN